MLIMQIVLLTYERRLLWLKGPDHLFFYFVSKRILNESNLYLNAIASKKQTIMPSNLWNVNHAFVENEGLLNNSKQLKVFVLEQLNSSHFHFSLNTWLVGVISGQSSAKHTSVQCCQQFLETYKRFHSEQIAKLHLPLI